MKFFKFLFFYTLFCYSTCSFTYKLRSKLSNNFITKTVHKEKNVSTFIPNVQGASNIYACSNDLCRKIKEFEVDPDYENSCFEEYLPIYFLLTSIDNETEISFGYLHSDGIQIVSNQSLANICKIIKR